MLIKTTLAKAGVFHIEVAPSLDGKVFVTISGIRATEHPDNCLEQLHGSGQCGSLNGALLAIGLAIGTEMDAQGIRPPETFEGQGNLHAQQVRSLLMGHA
jgi:hypothetical protein